MKIANQGNLLLTWHCECAQHRDLKIKKRINILDNLFIIVTQPQRSLLFFKIMTSANMLLRLIAQHFLGDLGAL